jgi:quinohemoprotein ethanol dehydrogenase
MNVGWKYGAQPRRLLTFALDGQAVLPPSPPPDMAVHAVDDPALTLDPAQVQAGRVLSVNCMVCHGPSFRGVGAPGPDLRESKLALNRDAFYAVVHDGALQSHGMPKFDNLSRAEIDQLYAFLRSTARAALKGESAGPEVAPPKL